MKIQEIIQSERTDIMYERWTPYRDELTGYITDAFLEDKTETKMGTKLETVAESEAGTETKAEAETKPCLAIWGAGGCNDIRLDVLAKYFKLVLIDCEKDKVKEAIHRYGLKEYEAVAADLFFYDIPMERYEEYEELLIRGADTEEIHRLLSELLCEAVSTDMELLPAFDYSVVVGLASQLNARLTALLYLYRENFPKEALEELIRHIGIMDKEGVRRLWEIVSRSTRVKIMCGYEIGISETKEELNLEANSFLKRHITQCIEKGLCIKEEPDKNIIWPFVEGKSYVMNIETLRMRKKYEDVQ